MDHLRWKTLAEITAEDRVPVFEPVFAPAADTELEEDYTPEPWGLLADHLPESEDILVVPPVPAPVPPPVPEAPPPALPVEAPEPAEVSRDEEPPKPRHSIAPYVVGLLLLLLFIIAAFLLLRDDSSPAVGGEDPIEATRSEGGAASDAEAVAVTERLSAWSNDTREFLSGAPGELSEARAQALEEQYDRLMLDVGALPEDVRTDDSVAARLDEAEEVRAALQALRTVPEVPEATASEDPPLVAAPPPTPPARRRAERERTPPPQRRTPPTTREEEPPPAQDLATEEPNPPVRLPAPVQEEPEGPVKIEDLLRGGRYKVNETALNDVLKSGYGGVGVIGLEELRRMAAFSKAPLRLARVDENTSAQLPLNTSQPVEAAVLVPNQSGGTTLYLVVENE